MACDRCGERDRDYPEFVCGVCEVDRVSGSSGIPPFKPRGPRDGGGGPDAPTPPAPMPTGSGGGAVAYADSADFERRMPAVAEGSRAHRETWRGDIGAILPDLQGLALDEGERALVAKQLGDEFDPDRVRETAMLLSNQLQAASERGNLAPELLADAFGVAAWAICVGPREEPSVAQLSHLADPRLRFALGYSALRISTSA
jgi:hypothetical protein